jgi:acetoacetyl-CoA synthetase
MQPIWSPSAERSRRAQLARYMQFVQERHKAPVHDYASLHRWSVEFPENFWSALWDFCEVRAEQRATQILADGHRMPDAQWFVDARLNYAENLLRLDDDSPAVIFRNERGERRELSWRQLRGEVARIADGLRNAGVKEGDRVAGSLPNIPEAVIAMLATTSIGAIWSSSSPDVAAEGLLDRFGQIRPKVLFAVDGYTYAGSSADCIPAVRAIKDKIPTIECVVLVPYLQARAGLDGIDGATSFAAFGSPTAQQPFAQLPFEQPAFITYSSQSAGAPRCVVHGAGGTLIQQLAEHTLQADVSRGDLCFYVATCGSMTWHLHVAALAAGATIVLFDGAPLQPDPTVTWRIAAEEKVSLFGASPYFLAGCEQAGVRAGSQFDLSALATIVSTGAQPSASTCRYVYSQVKQDVLLASMAGGTDVMASFGSGCPLVPVYEGEIQRLTLGMKTQIYDDAGQAVIDTQGRLVCSAPFPAMPVGLWGDTKGSRFQSAYFSRYPNVWCPDDLATITARGGLMVHGRSQ